MFYEARWKTVREGEHAGSVLLPSSEHFRINHLRKSLTIQQGLEASGQDFLAAKHIEDS